MKVMNRAKDCTLRTYIDCMFENNLEALIIEGEPTPDELINAWSEIILEYNDLCGVNIPEVEKKRRICEVDLSIKVCNLCFIGLTTAVEQLATVPVTELNEPALESTLGFISLIHGNIALLKQNAIALTWRNDVQGFKKQLKAAQIRYKLKYVRLDELNKELETVQAEAIKPPTVTDFYDRINSIEALMNIRINENEMNLARFASLVKQYATLSARQSPS